VAMRRRSWVTEFKLESGIGWSQFEWHNDPGGPRISWSSNPCPLGTDGRAGAQTPTIDSFLDTLSKLPKTGGGTNSSAGRGTKTGEPSKR